MRLTNVRIRNYRCIKDVSIDLDETTVLIGENNSGKTAFLHAIRACLGELRSRSARLFHEYDYHLPDPESSPVDSAPIEIELSFMEPKPSSWSDDLIGEVNDIAAIDSSDRYRIVFRLTSAFDREAEDFSVEWAFLDAERNELPAKSAGQLATLQRMAPVFYLTALRDAASHFGTRGRFWRDFLSESGIPEEDRKRFEQTFSELNDDLVASHEPLKEVRSRLEDARKVMDLGSAGDAVTIDALPTKLFSLLSRTQGEYECSVRREDSRRPSGRRHAKSGSTAVVWRVLAQPTTGPPGKPDYRSRRTGSASAPVSDSLLDADRSRPAGTEAGIHPQRGPPGERRRPVGQTLRSFGW